MSKQKDIASILAQLTVTTANESVVEHDAILKEYDRKNADDTGLLIKLVTIFGAVLAALAFLFFLAMSNMLNSGIALLVIGLGFIIGSIWLNTLENSLAFVTTSITGFIVGLSLFCFGLEKVKSSTELSCFLVILIASFSLFTTRSYIFSFISVITIGGSAIGLTISHQHYELIYVYISVLTILMTYFFLREAKLLSGNKSIADRYEPIRAGLLASFLVGLSFTGLKKGIIPFSEVYKWIPSIFIVAAVLYLLHTIVHHFNINKPVHRWLTYLVALIVLLPTTFAPAISGSLLILLLSFAVNYKTGLTMGILGLAYFTAQYYYNLDLSLLTKSCILFSSGLVFILTYLLIIKKIKPDETI